MNIHALDFVSVAAAAVCVARDTVEAELGGGCRVSQANQLARISLIHTLASATAVLRDTCQVSRPSGQSLQPMAGSSFLPIMSKMIGVQA